MPSEKKIIRADRGVTLTEVTLRSGATIAAVAYVLQSQRTPEAPTFDSLTAAEISFSEEVMRCKAQN